MFSEFKFQDKRLRGIKLRRKRFVFFHCLKWGYRYAPVNLSSNPFVIAPYVRDSLLWVPLSSDGA